MRTGADLLVERLLAHGVNTIFGMPGSHSTALYDAFLRSGQIRTILVRNEQAGAYAADGYARATGQPGVICTTAGPGATNALSGVAEAWADSTPVLLLTGHVNHDRMHLECGNYHEIDLENILRPCTKFVATVRSHADIGPAVSGAFGALRRGRRRPAALVLPQDLMRMSATHGPPEPPDLYPQAEDSLDGAAIDRAGALLGQAQHPLLLAGGGAVWGNAGAWMHRLARRLDCPLATTLNGKGIIDERDQLSVGHLRSARGQAALAQADLILAVGCRFTEVMTGFRRMKIPANLVQIDVDAGQIGMNYPVAMGIVGEADPVLRGIVKALPRRLCSDWTDAWDRVRAAQPERTEWLIEVLRAELPDNAMLFTDASEMAYRMHTDFPAYRPRSFFYPSNYIALGWGFPAALGAAVACPEHVVASFSGDGGFVMTCQELATAARYHLRMLILVHNDNAYGAIKHHQRLKHDGRYLDTDLNNPDFVQLATAFGVPGFRAKNAAELTETIRQALRREGPTLIEVPDEWRYLRE